MVSAQSVVTCADRADGGAPVSPCGTSQAGVAQSPVVMTVYVLGADDAAAYGMRPNLRADLGLAGTIMVTTLVLYAIMSAMGDVLRGVGWMGRIG